jgi:hypothetical protein
MPMTAEQKLAQILAIVTGNPVDAPPTPWYRDTSTPVPTEPLADVTNVEEIKRYMAHGYKTDLTHGVAPSDWATMLTYCDKIAAAQSPQEADAVIAGAGHFPPDVAINIVLGGGTQGGGFSPLSIFAPWGSGFDMVQSAAWLTALPGTPGPGY